MPFIGLGLLHILVAIYFGIHAMRTGRQLYWLIILFSFPALGSLVYFFAEYMPELRNNPNAHKAKKVISQAIDPGRNLRDAQRAVDLSPSADNRRRLGEALLDAGQSEAAISEFRAAMQGVHSDDPALGAGLARALIECQRYGEATSMLAELSARAPLSQELVLMQARALAASGNATAARASFERAMQLDANAETRCHYASFLAEHGDNGKARELFDSIVRDSLHWPRYAKAQNREWLSRAKMGLDRL